METKTQYKILQGCCTKDPLILIKFDGEYSYWGWTSKKWICDPNILSRYCMDANFQPITERDVEKIIKTKHYTSWILDIWTSCSIETIVEMPERIIWYLMQFRCSLHTQFTQNIARVDVTRNMTKMHINGCDILLTSLLTRWPHFKKSGYCLITSMELSKSPSDTGGLLTRLLLENGLNVFFFKRSYSRSFSSFSNTWQVKYSINPLVKEISCAYCQWYQYDNIQEVIRGYFL